MNVAETNLFGLPEKCTSHCQCKKKKLQSVVNTLNSKQKILIHIENRLQMQVFVEVFHTVNLLHVEHTLNAVFTLKHANSFV